MSGPGSGEGLSAPRLPVTASASRRISSYCKGKGWQRTLDGHCPDYKLKWCEVKSRDSYCSFREGGRGLRAVGGASGSGWLERGSRWARVVGGASQGGRSLWAGPLGAGPGVVGGDLTGSGRAVSVALEIEGGVSLELWLWPCGLWARSGRVGGGSTDCGRGILELWAGFT